MPLLFTSKTGEIFQAKPSNISVTTSSLDSVNSLPTTPPSQMTSPLFTALGVNNVSKDSLPAPRVPLPEILKLCLRNASCGHSMPLIKLASPYQLLEIQTPSPPPFLPGLSPKRSTRQIAVRTREDTLNVSSVYNEYGELVNAKTVATFANSADLSTTQMLRVIKRGYQHDFRDKLGEIIVIQMGDQQGCIAIEDVKMMFNGRLSTGSLKARPDKPLSEMTPEESHRVAVYHGLPRVLEIGCGDGAWCFKAKMEQPDWVVEGVDDTDHWSCVHKGLALKDFMQPDTGGIPNDYFGKVHSVQDKPEFTVRNLNCLLAHPNPIPHNLYRLVRGRDIFDRIESYKTFLEDIRSILQPDGVVEFVELDPRPRAMYARRSRNEAKDHKSCPMTNWSGKIEDRFKGKFDEELATCVPGWTGRVAERLKANLRPWDGVAAANLKCWLEGAGFWDVKELVAPLPVGGDTRPGQLLKNFILDQLKLENSIPKLLLELPKVEIEAFEHGSYYLNIHIVTGRKPNDPRAGDLLMDGSRQEMSASKYDAMARFNNDKSSQ